MKLLFLILALMTMAACAQPSGSTGGGSPAPSVLAPTPVASPTPALPPSPYLICDSNLACHGGNLGSDKMTVNVTFQFLGPMSNGQYVSGYSVTSDETQVCIYATIQIIGQPASYNAQHCGTSFNTQIRTIY